MASSTPSLPSLTDDEVTLPTLRMSYEDYQKWYDGDAGRRGEWVDGEVIPFMTTSDRHQRILTFLVTLLTNYFQLRPGGRVYSQTFELRSRERAAREPDLLVVLDLHRERVQAVRVVGAADVVVEIISPDSVSRDRRVKFAEYAAAGVPEYWLIDPRGGHESFEVFALGSGRGYVGVEAEPDGKLPSQVLPGVWADASWLVGDDLPDVIRLAIAMAGFESLPEVGSLKDGR